MGNTEERSEKSLTPPCCVCCDRRETQDAHFPLRKSKGGQKTIPPCPTHHRVLDHGRITPDEMECIWKTCFPEVKVADVHEFLSWAHENGYPYDRFYFVTPARLIEDDNQPRTTSGE